MARRIEIIAHRGAGQGFVDPDAPPENTLPAFEYAWDSGAEGAELDVQLTRDGELIVIHDATTRRTTDASWVVRKHTLDELRTLDAGKWKAPRFSGIRLPTLQEVIAALPAGKRLSIELKTGPEAIPALSRVLAASGKPAADLSIISFRLDSVQLAKERLPEYECRLITDFHGITLPVGIDALIRRVQGAGLDGIDISWPFPQGLPGRLKERGLVCTVWTVNDVQVARTLEEGPIRAITTDVPRTIRAALQPEAA